MSGVIEGCSYDEHTHVVAADEEGLSALSRTVGLARAHRAPQSISLEDSNSAGFGNSDPRLTSIRVERPTDIGAIQFSLAGSELRIKGGETAFSVLGNSLAALAVQQRQAGAASPRFEPRWFEGDDFLQEDSDEVSFLRLPIEPPLRHP